MNKNQFITELDRSLQKLPTAERQDIIQDFEEHFSFGLEEGKSAEEISSALGSPQQIAKEMVATYHIEKVETTASTGNIIRAVWAVIGLGFFNLVIVLGPFIALAAVVIAGWTSAAAFISSPLMVFLNTIIFPKSFIWFDLFFSLFLMGVGIFIAIGMFHATNALVKGFIRYLKFNAKLVKGGLADE